MTRDGRWLSCGPLARDAARAAAAKLDTLPSVAASLSRRCARVCKRCRYVVHRSSAVLAERRVPSLGVDGACMLFDRLTSELMALETSSPFHFTMAIMTVMIGFGDCCSSSRSRPPFGSMRTVFPPASRMRTTAGTTRLAVLQPPLFIDFSSFASAVLPTSMPLSFSAQKRSATSCSVSMPILARCLCATFIQKICELGSPMAILSMKVDHVNRRALRSAMRALRLHLKAFQLRWMR
mmetsp:Transcript_9883/g.25150  ORF Transcript_9883/g.25150 Transcript_9883/m.25150 type:complete len:237 (-) Transcript_9883:396-1106(-)